MTYTGDFPVELDKPWIAENLDMFSERSPQVYQEAGRGFWLVVPSDDATPCRYIAQDEMHRLPPQDSVDIERFVGDYNPKTQFVVAIAPEGRVSVYKVGIKNTFRPGIGGGKTHGN